ncbi:MAG TPA: N,N-dimethylformamidase beta subunit family domain-containing protein, partial [Jatrophihabitans sp.]|nr:N,N-dimethylformamidase beta subunit family domain-containing protein [Jatrophihabitans sp.]
MQSRPIVNVDWAIPAGRVGGIEGFASETSVEVGGNVTLFVSSSAAAFSVRAYRMGWYNGANGVLVWASPAIPAAEQPGPVLAPAATGTVTAPWRPTVTVSTRGWRPGDYLLKLQASSGGASYVPLAVRTPSAAGRVVLISPVTTWQAYNMWGGRDLYQGSDGSFDTRSRAVSFDRPYQLGAGAADFVRGELPVLAEAERLRLPLDYVTDIDLEQNPHLLDGARAVISMGHDEYWSPRMRSALTPARDAGTNIAFFGANGIFRRIRFASTALGADRLEINYKVAAEDPLFGKDNAAVTANWPAPPAADPESALVGPEYACNLGPGNISDGIVVAPNSWIFAGTGAQAGQALPRLIASESDAVESAEPTPRPLEILLH